jgi:DNA-binding NtrC family response regulator
VILLETPPLRTRAGDVEELAQVFLKRFNEKQKRTIEGFTPEALEVFLVHRWPGNIRELENVMERVVTLESGNRIEVSTLPPEMVLSARKEAGKPRELILKPDFTLGPVQMDEIMEQVRAFYLAQALVYTKGDPERAQDLLK